MDPSAEDPSSDSVPANQVPRIHDGGGDEKTPSGDGEGEGEGEREGEFRDAGDVSYTPYRPPKIRVRGLDYGK